MRKGSTKIGMFKLPPESQRKPKFSLYILLNMFSVNIDQPYLYAAYYLMRIYNILLLIFTVITLLIYLLHRHYGFLPNLMAIADAENYFELYLYLLNYTGLISFLILFVFLYWLNKHFSFKKYNYLEPGALGKKVYNPFGKPPSRRTNKISAIIGILSFWPVVLYPSLFGYYFYKDEFDGYFISQFDNTLFIACAALFIAFWQNLFFQLYFYLSFGFLSSTFYISNNEKGSVA
jgi:hypothetical protein